MTTEIAQPKTIKQILANSIALALHAYWRIFAIVAFLAFYSILARLYNLLTPAHYQHRASIGLLIFFVVYLISILFNGALLHRLNCIYKGLAFTSSDAFAVAKRRYFALLGGFLLITLIGFFGTIALVIPGIFFVTMLAFFAPKIIIDNEKLLQSFKQSWHLVWGNWWRTFFIFLLAFLIPLLLLIIVLFLFTFIGQLVGYMFNLGIAGIEKYLTWQELVIEVVFSFLFIPWFNSIFIIQFHDLKTRNKPRNQIIIHPNRPN